MRGASSGPYSHQYSGTDVVVENPSAAGGMDLNGEQEAKSKKQE
jgi:hypothetical protein